MTHRQPRAGLAKSPALRALDAWWKDAIERGAISAIGLSFPTEGTENCRGEPIPVGGKAAMTPDDVPPSTPVAALGQIAVGRQRGLGNVIDPTPGIGVLENETRHSLLFSRGFVPVCDYCGRADETLLRHHL